MAEDLRPALASLWRSRTSTAEVDFLGSAVFVSPGLLLTAGHIFDRRTAAEVFARPAVDATLAYSIADLQRHAELDAALVRIERHPTGAVVLPLLIDPTFQPGAGCTLNGYFEGRAETGLPLQVLNWDPAERWFVTAPRQPAGHSGSAIGIDDRLWGLTVEHYVDPAVDRGCALALHQLWRGWLDTLLPRADVATLAPPAPTEVAGFVGETERGPTRPTIVCSWSEYLSMFGAPLPARRSFLGGAVRGYFENGGSLACIVRVLSPQARRAAVVIPTDDPEQALVVEALESGGFGNDLMVGVEPGARVGIRWTVAALNGRSPADAATDPEDDYDNLSVGDVGPNPLMRVVEGRSRRISLRCENGSRPAAMPQPGLWLLTGGDDGSATAADLVGARASTASGGSGLQALDTMGDEVSLVCIPDAVHPRFTPDEQAQLLGELVALAERHKAFAVLALPREQKPADRPRAPLDSSYGAVYVPWVTVATPDGGEADVPPVGHVAGALARQTATVGVHHAPRGLVLQGVLRPQGDATLDGMADARAVQALERRGINALCVDTRTGRTVIASAITMSIDEQWQPIRVCRFRSFVQRHVNRLLAWATFQAADEATWAEVRRRVEEFMGTLWREGALAGSSPEEAFFVRCDRSTMTVSDIDNGRLMCFFGYALRDPDAPGAAPATTPVVLSNICTGNRRDGP